jgi:hypothetical protein
MLRPVRRGGPPTERTGIVVLRAWIEPDSAPGTGLRVRITQTADVEHGDSVTVAVASVEDAITVVRRFLEAFAHDGDGAVTET